LPVVKLIVAPGLSLRSGGVFYSKSHTALLMQALPGHKVFSIIASGNDTRINMTVNSQKPRILIVDDNFAIRDLIKSFYEEYDLELIEAVNGKDAVEMARACTPDLILLDLQMPVLNGYEAATILKNDEAVKDIPILVVTGQEHGEVAERINGMYDGYVSKPFKKADLIRATIECLPGSLPGIIN
jgi:CheY-like chemotaxis protein